MTPPRSYTPAAFRASMDRACQKLWRTLILRRCKFTCEMCGASKPKEAGGILWIQAAHIIGRGYWFLRHHPTNGLGLCTDCHVDWKIIEWLERTDPKRLAWLRKMRNKNIPTRAVELQQVYNGLLEPALGGF